MSIRQKGLVAIELYRAALLLALSLVFNIGPYLIRSLASVFNNSIRLGFLLTGTELKI